MATVEYQSVFVECASQPTHHFQALCQNVRQRPLFAGNEEIFDRLAQARLQVAVAVDKGWMDPAAASSQMTILEQTAHLQMEKNVADYETRWQNFAVAMHQLGEQQRQQQMHQETLNALNRPVYCTTRSTGWNYSSTSCQ